MDLETFRDQLVVWGITPQVLVAIGICSIITLFFSLRVVAKWFMGFYELQSEMQQVRKQLADMHTLLTVNTVAIKKELQEEIQESVSIKAAVTSKVDSFRLTNH